ncbi:MAG TPA: methylmalonyl-CoA mutase family protein, partial [Bacillota bacterium]|nr:methylmalonyl-CoA mutase family protein [Bacillota bacterium]
QEPVNIEILKIDPAVEERQVQRLRELKARRDNLAVKAALERLKQAAQGSDGLIPYILEAVKVYATEGEIVAVLKEVFGEYREQPLF